MALCGGHLHVGPRHRQRSSELRDLHLCGRWLFAERAEWRVRPAGQERGDEVKRFNSAIDNYYFTLLFFCLNDCRDCRDCFV